MRTSTIVMVVLAGVFGLLAVFVAQSWLNKQAAERMKNLQANKGAVSSRTVVVASKPLRFGTEITKANLREVGWPEDAVPEGAFAKITDLLSGERRVALTAIEVNEPVLKTKVSGDGQRGTLSATLREGLKAVTVRVTDVEGVGGFILPGDHVDVSLTRKIDRDNSTNVVVLQNIRVLAIDQVADQRTEKPTVAKAVTLEVDVAGAQKLALSASIGRLSLILRRAGDVASEYTRNMTISDLAVSGTVAARAKGTEEGLTTIGVTRASTRQEYRVPIDNRDKVAANGGS